MKGALRKGRIQIRQADTQDVPAIVTLLHDDPQGRLREDTSNAARPQYLSAFAEIMDDPRSELLVLDADGAVVGCLQLSVIPGLSHCGIRRCLIEDVRIAVPIVALVWVAP